MVKENIIVWFEILNTYVELFNKILFIKLEKLKKGLVLMTKTKVQNRWLLSIAIPDFENYGENCGILCLFWVVKPFMILVTKSMNDSVDLTIDQIGLQLLYFKIINAVIFDNLEINGLVLLIDIQI